MAWFEVRPSALHGSGAFALKPIPARTKIVEYLGERLTDADVEERYGAEQLDNPHTFLFWVRDDLYVDAAVGGNDARFINHSCDPNCEVEIEDDRVFIYAIRDIDPGEELTYDYSLDVEEDPTPELQQVFACRCGAECCRGTMLELED